MARRLASLLASLGLALHLVLAGPAPLALAHTPDYPIPNGHFYTQAGGSPELLAGFAISNDGGIPFWREYQRLGGVRSLGYPISRRFNWGSWTAQAVQRGVMVWYPDRGRVELANVMDELSSAGFDDWLRDVKLIPAPFDPHEEDGMDFAAVQARRLAFLDRNPAVKQRFLAERNWMELYGLPVSFDEMEHVWVLRAQRVVFQQWKVDLPWARRGQITMAHGGDLAKEAGLIPAEVAGPEAPTIYRAQSPERPVRMQVPKLGINAPITAYGLDQLEADGALPAPRRADEVAWYDYSGRAGEANNGVYSGHVDWLGRPAVFTRIKELVNGDVIVLVGDRGSRFTYEVLGCDDVECHLPLASRPDVDEFVGYSAFSHLTMITCEGEWDRIRRDYSHRRIVRARLVGVTDAAGTPQELIAEQFPPHYPIFSADAAQPRP